MEGDENFDHEEMEGDVNYFDFERNPDSDVDNDNDIYNDFDDDEYFEEVERRKEIATLKSMNAQVEVREMYRKEIMQRRYDRELILDSISDTVSADDSDISSSDWDLDSGSSRTEDADETIAFDFEDAGEENAFNFEDEVENVYGFEDEVENYIPSDERSPDKVADADAEYEVGSVYGFGIPNAYHWTQVCPFHQPQFMANVPITANLTSSCTEVPLGCSQNPGARQNSPNEASGPEQLQLLVSGHISTLPNLANLDNVYNPYKRSPDKVADADAGAPGYSGSCRVLRSRKIKEPGEIDGAAGYSGTRRVLRSREIKGPSEIDGVAGYSGKSRVRRTRNGKEPGDIGGAAGYSGTRRVLRSREIKGPSEIDGVAGYSGKSRVRRIRNGKEPGDIDGAAGYSGTCRVLRSREIKEPGEIDDVAGESGCSRVLRRRKGRMPQNGPV
ncbi:hypothetical protein HNY73_010440 [Argiope bruennichi]|uniref:Uncharacterized protein n=1 Tax=Argiope bruennichi TaxID=94029 RepID=A0A8T0F2Y2_ARGBR|nr:hypothetical protein HNY73_010440 [Argiope bruennichi]KAF8784812.1 hypothetical protein HNY73_010440 [Argiope bruennichi]